MRIYFDVSTLDPDKVTGVGIYMIQLVKSLINTEDIECIPVIKPSRIKKKKKLSKFLNIPVHIMWPWIGFREPDSVYHGPDFKIQKSLVKKNIVTIHDMGVFKKKYNNPAFFKKGIRDLSRVLTSSPDAIIANSEFTKKEILAYFPELQCPIYVTHLGCDSKKTIPNTPTSLSDYILFLGTLERRKNILGVIKAFELLVKKGHTEKLILAGKWGFGREEIQDAISNSSAYSQIVLLNYVSDEKADELFRNAKAFIFPSWYEGFGIPILEAMTYGCPVVASSGGVLEEIAGDAALFASPDNPEEIASATSELLTNAKLRDSLIAKGYEQSKKFTWKRCCDRTLSVYKEVLIK
ncbi:glycosyltransferase family 1 protein [Bdellovibrio sp. 22V]|uniref:glycosyltransferase family 4 protein n=1 Tax=Bdellovibrio sp. 22V TaxID=3044166 RepID=UPI002543320D|nr:glycosyltransferase family 1 protein [Bdellovibrio sp. 22V]WII71839.1 glycosyltransferase family 1 protein [Bdellovibrio sp. 22V]